MDLSTIQMHLDNFVNTWEGWAKVLGGLQAFGHLFVGGDMAPIKGINENLSSYADFLSSK
ncbi:hypothetical protein [Corynebacterium kefirresidentii]|uniref:hypothetical protein n=1 Tax=Corynebacterium kefirresidentii TaxID=1979527 RepID=UPI0037366608